MAPFFLCLHRKSAGIGAQQLQFEHYLFFVLGIMCARRDKRDRGLGRASREPPG
jgi:hypothetical protein